MENIIHSPKLIFKLNPKVIYNDYTISDLHYYKLHLTIDYIKENQYKKIVTKFLDEEHMIEIHRWLGNNSYVEYRNFECENATDIVVLDIFEDTSDTYENLLIFQTKKPEKEIYNYLVMGNDYFGNSFVLTEEFEWSICDGYNNMEIEYEINDIEEIEHINTYNPRNYKLENIIKSFEMLC
jgi:hypothetical protein